MTAFFGPGGAFYCAAWKPLVLLVRYPIAFFVAL